MIADASVLILFSRIGRLDLLKSLFDRLFIPLAVREEVFAKGPVLPDVRGVEEALHDGWIKGVPVDGKAVGRLTERFPNLGLGENACLALAQQTGERVVLMDDADGRKAARLLGIQPVGCLGVVARAYRTRVLGDREAVSRTVRALLDAGLWVSADIIEAFWERMGGRG